MTVQPNRKPLKRKCDCKLSMKNCKHCIEYALETWKRVIEKQ